MILTGTRHMQSPQAKGTALEELVYKSLHICKLIVYKCKLAVDEPNIHTLVCCYVHSKFTKQYTSVCIFGSCTESLHFVN